MTTTCQTVTIPTSPPVCVDTTWTCSGTDGLEHSNCGNTRTTTPCTLGYQALQMNVGLIPVDLRYDVNNNGVVDSGDATLLMSGTPLRALEPANITATAFPTPTIPTGTYNTVAVDITWTNTGTVTGSFVPQVSIGGSIVDLGEGTITLASGEIHHSAKTLSGVIAGNQNICPVPN